MCRVIQVGLVALVAVMATSAIALAAPTGWVAGNGASYEDGVVTLDNVGGAGSSYENPALGVPVKNGDTISFEYRTDDVACAGGTPRVFIQGGAYNTFDQDPAGPGACGTDADNDGWYTVTGTISGITNGTAGYTGIVNDNPSDPGTIQVRNLTINGQAVLLAPAPTNAQQCKNGGWQAGGYQNQGQCVSSFAKAT
jgi:hypothetical protein